MSNENNNFRDLKRLLKLKQHEVPPPGYFNHFSGDVIARIRAGESGADAGMVDQLQTSAPWLVSILRVFQAKPGVIGGFATSLCLLLLIGVVMVDRQEGVSTSGPMAALPASGATGTTTLASAMPLVPAESGGITIGSNSVTMQPVASLFGSQNPLFQNASFLSGQ